jgi:hypothetical protein
MGCLDVWQCLGGADCDGLGLVGVWPPGLMSWKLGLRGSDGMCTGVA